MSRAERYRAGRERRLELHTARGPIRPNDVALTIGLLVVAAIVLPVVTTLGAFTAVASDGCGTATCAGLVQGAATGGVIVPVVVFFTGVVVSIVRLVRHLRGWPAAVVTIGAEIVCLGLAWGLAALAAAF